MKSKYIKWGVIVFVVVFFFSFFVSSYNSLVEKRAEIEKSLADIESQYQRRADLIPNLVTIVKKYADYEQKTFLEVAQARAEAYRPQINLDELTDENIAKFQAGDGEMSQTLGRLIAIGESYPELKASERFQSLMDEVAGTENRVNAARLNYNSAAKEYNVFVQKFPRNIIASMFGFSSVKSFASQPGAQRVPSIEL